MRRKFSIFFFSIFLVLPVYSQNRFPQPQGFVNDFADILSYSERIKLESLFRDLEAKTGAEVAVVTVKTTFPLDIETYAVELFQDWGIGKKGKDNGVLFLVALEDRKMRIEVGYGLEGAIPDALAKQIIVNIVTPSFKQGDYSEGIMKGSVAIAKLVAEEYNVGLPEMEELPAVDISSGSSRGKVLYLLLNLLFFIIIFGFRWGFLWWAILTPGNYHRRDGFWYGSGYGGYSGGFSGGFGGFGGGLSGGGGASGSW